MKKVRTILSLVAVFCMVFAPLAEAVTLEGSGTLIAKGQGTAKFKGSSDLNLKGNGVLWVKDNAGDAQIDVKGYGYKKVLSDGTVRYSGFHGHAKISGSNIKVRIRGWRIHMVVKGTGTAYLRGKGTYHVNEKKGRWSLRSTYIEVSETKETTNSASQ